MDRSDQIQFYKDYVRPFYDGKDQGHNFQHIERIIARLNELREGIYPAPSERKLNFISCFHGLVFKIQHETLFRDQTVQFLEDLGWASDEIRGAFISLARHLSAPLEAEEMMVHDANYVEVTGAFGIAKAFTVGGSRGQAYEETLEIFASNLNKVVFCTPYGKKHYEARKDYSRAFIEMLRDDLK